MDYGRPCNVLRERKHNRNLFVIVHRIIDESTSYFVRCIRHCKTSNKPIIVKLQALSRVRHEELRKCTTLSVDYKSMKPFVRGNGVLSVVEERFICIGVRSRPVITRVGGREMKRTPALFAILSLRHLRKLEGIERSPRRRGNLVSMRYFVAT